MGSVKVAGKISTLSDPVDQQDAATKAYVDSISPSPGTTSGVMLYWNGTARVSVPLGNPGII